MTGDEGGSRHSRLELSTRILDSSTHHQHRYHHAPAPTVPMVGGTILHFSDPVVICVFCFGGRISRFVGNT